jgi:hypothetical protein
MKPTLPKARRENLAAAAWLTDRNNLTHHLIGIIVQLLCLVNMDIKSLHLMDRRVVRRTTATVKRRCHEQTKPAACNRSAAKTRIRQTSSLTFQFNQQLCEYHTNSRSQLATAPTTLR